MSFYIVSHDEGGRVKVIRTSLLVPCFLLAIVCLPLLPLLVEIIKDIPFYFEMISK